MYNTEEIERGGGKKRYNTENQIGFRKNREIMNNVYVLNYSVQKQLCRFRGQEITDKGIKGKRSKRK